MHAPSLFIAVPVAIVLVASATRSSASPTMIVNDKHHSSMQHKTKPQTIPHATPASRRTRAKHVVVEPRSLDAVCTVLDVCLDQLHSDHDGVLSASNAFTSTAQKANSKSAHGSSYQQDCVAGLTSFQHSLDPLQSLLAQLGSNKGLANYDKSNKIETLLREIVDSSKYTLNDVDALVYATPILGHVLGPIVYEIKCILDDLLNATENITDGLLNSLAPLLRPLIKSATGTVCKSIVPPVAGLCSL